MRPLLSAVGQMLLALAVLLLLAFIVLMLFVWTIPAPAYPLIDHISGQVVLMAVIVVQAVFHTAQSAAKDSLLQSQSNALATSTPVVVTPPAEKLETK